MNGNLEQDSPLPDNIDDSPEEQLKANLLKDVVTGSSDNGFKGRTINRQPSDTNSVLEIRHQAGESSPTEVAQVSPKQVPGDAKPATGAIDRAAQKNNDDIFTRPPRGMAVFADFIAQLKPTDPNALSRGWIAEKDRLYITAKLSELALRAKLERTAIKDRGDDGLPVSFVSPKFLNESIKIHQSLLKDGNFSDEHLTTLLKDSPSALLEIELQSLMSHKTAEERRVYCEGYLANLNKRLSNILTKETERDNLNKKINKLENSPSYHLTQAEIIGYLKEEYQYEAKDLTDPAGRLKLEEAFGAQWGKNTLVGASSSQKENSIMLAYFQDLSNAINMLRSVPEAIKYVDFISKARKENISVSSFTSLDSWRLDQKKKRFVVVIEGMPMDMDKEKDGVHRAALTMVNSLKPYGIQIDDERHKGQYEKTLEGKYNLDQQTQAITVIKYVNASKKKGKQKAY